MNLSLDKFFTSQKRLNPTRRRWPDSLTANGKGGDIFFENAR